MQRYRFSESRDLWPRLAGACAVFLLSALFIRAQTTAPPAAHPTVIGAAAVDSRQAAVRAQTRFLGWKFAALYPELSSKWLQATRQRSAASLPAASGPSIRAPESSSAGFSNSGFAFLPGLPTGYIPTAVTTGDFNGDGHMDIAVSNGGDDSVYVMLGNGDGTFQVPEILYTQGQSPT